MIIINKHNNNHQKKKLASQNSDIRISSHQPTAVEPLGLFRLNSVGVKMMGPWKPKTIRCFPIPSMCTLLGVLICAGPESNFRNMARVTNVYKGDLQ